MRSITHKLEFGLAANVELFDKIFNDGINKTTSYNKDVCYRLLCVGQFNLVNRNYARAYAKGGLGVGLFYQYDWHNKSTGETEDRRFITPCLDCVVGAEYGSGSLRPFVEFGYGAQGILAFGIRSRF